MTIILLGADGYIGWPLLCHLALHTEERLVAVDDLSKRRRIAAEGYGSVLPILPFQERLQELRTLAGRDDIEGVEAEVSEVITELVARHRPRALYHLAQIPSAPYSMKSLAAARETLVNNEVGNLALLFALREHSPATHLIKMGSMGEYARCGVPLAEGYVDAVLDGVQAQGLVPFPRAADDVYHITKINDSNYVAMAARVWGLASTDVMQSVVYGVHADLLRTRQELATYFACDSTFGSVLNRMVAQALQGVPLTVYGPGTATTGLIHLEDSLAAMLRWSVEPAEAGEHRVINQTTETRISILDIARLVQEVASSRGHRIELDHQYDPRFETERPAEAGPARNLRLRQTGLPATSLRDGVTRLWDDLAPYRDRLAAASDPPYVDWKRGDTLHLGLAGRRLPLNPGTLSDPLPEVTRAMAAFQAGVAGYPLASYQHGRALCEQWRQAAAEAFGGDWRGWAQGDGHTTTIDRLAASLRLRTSAPQVVVTTRHEHVGGIGAFQQHPAFAVQEVELEGLTEAAGDLFFLSHVTYDLNQDLAPRIRALVDRPDAPIVIVDGCQAVGQVPVDVEALGCHAYLASCHKWLGGPQGTGILYLRPDARESWPTPFWAGDPLCSDSVMGRWEPRGGQDFSRLAGLLTALALARSEEVRRNLREPFLRGLQERLGDAVRIRTPQHPEEPGRVVVFELPDRDVYQVYRALNDRGVHLKCINNHRLRVLRAGFPWWLPGRVVEEALEIIATVVLQEGTP